MRQLLLFFEENKRSIFMTLFLSLVSFLVYSLYLVYVGIPATMEYFGVGAEVIGR